MTEWTHTAKRSVKHSARARRGVGFGVAWIATVALLLVAGCAGPKVSTDHDTYTDFSGFRSYAWAPKNDAGADPRVDNDLLGARVRRAVDRELRMAGYEEVESNPDFWVTYQSVMDSKLDANSYFGNYDQLGFRHRGGVFTDVREIEIGTLMVDVLSGEGEPKLVWRGSAVSRVRDGQSAEERTAHVNEAVAKILSRFPPES